MNWRYFLSVVSGGVGYVVGTVTHSAILGAAAASAVATLGGRLLHLQDPPAPK